MKTTRVMTSRVSNNLDFLYKNSVKAWCGVIFSIQGLLHHDDYSTTLLKVSYQIIQHLGSLYSTPPISHHMYLHRMLRLTWLTNCTVFFRIGRSPGRQKCVTSGMTGSGQTSNQLQYIHEYTIKYVYTHYYIMWYRSDI